MNKPISLRPMDKVALELGHICIRWAWIENTIDEMLGDFIPIDETQVGQAIFGNADIRGKVQMLKAVGFLRKEDPQWFDLLLTTLDTIDNNLRTRRNALVHAAWFRPNGRRFVRLSRKTRITRPQAFKMELSTGEDVPVRLSEIKKLSNDLMDALVNLMVVFGYHIRRDGERLSHAISFQQYTREASLTPRNARAKRSRQPQSSHP